MNAMVSFNIGLGTMFPQPSQHLYRMAERNFQSRSLAAARRRLRRIPAHRRFGGYMPPLVRDRPRSYIITSPAWRYV